MAAKTEDAINEADQVPSAIAGDGANEDLLENHLWYAEVEARRRIRHKFPESARLDYLYPAQPDPHRAEYFDPEETHRDAALNEELMAIDGIRVSDSYIVIPYETVADLDTEPSKLDDLDKLVWEILGKMRVAETEVEGGAKGTGLRYIIQDAPDLPPTADVRRTDPRPVYVEVPPSHHWCELQSLYDKRDRQDRDSKGLITARDSETGTGKTTLAEALCLSQDDGFTVENCTLDGPTYVRKYLDLAPGDFLLGDEMEQMADSRRSMGEENVLLTQFWATMRAWQVSTIVTMPSSSMIDKRLRELADYRINVIERGLGVVYKTKVPDHPQDGSSPQPYEVRMHRIRWRDLAGHAVHEGLKSLKKDHLPEHAETFFEGEEGEEAITPETMPKDLRDELMRMTYEETDLTHGEIASLPWVGLDRSTVSKIV